ncbi:MAG: ATP-grasp domain-containing protein [Deltaproteobacteria bacterium]|nr:ATP-grasp domain-containing protein [Deltaproteobacteria bacterium]
MADIRLENVSKTYVRPVGLAADLRYPAVVKPANSRPFYMHYGIKAYLAYTPEDLVRTFEEFSSTGHVMLIEEFIEGGDQNVYSVQTCVDGQGNSMIGFVHQNILQEPPVFGPLLVSQHVQQPEVAMLCQRAIRALGFHSYICDLEFKYDPVNRAWKFLELNPRPVMTTMLPTMSGVNVPFMAYRQLLGHAVPRYGVSRPGMSWVMELTTPNGYRNLGSLILASRKRHFRDVVYAFFSTDDPKPFFYALMVGVQEVRNKLALGRMSG